MTYPSRKRHAGMPALSRWLLAGSRKACGETISGASPIQLNDLLTINLSGPGTIDHVINDTGGPVSSANPDVASQVVSYP